jgi:CheY-like chemotaxis protein
MNGYEATAAIRALEGADRHTPIIALTAGARREDRERCLAEGMDAYLAKPVSKDALLALVALSVGGPKAADAVPLPAEAPCRRLVARPAARRAGVYRGAPMRTAAVPPRSPAAARAASRRRLLGLDLIELGALVALSGLSVVALAALATKGRPLSGADGLLAADQLQYFAWIREAAHHGLIGNRFDLAPGARSFAHPGFALSGGLHALGLSVPLAYLVWKPVAVAITFAAFCATCAASSIPSTSAAGMPPSCSRSSRSCPRRGSWRGRAGAASRASTPSTSSRARCGRASTCGAI